MNYRDVALRSFWKVLLRDFLKHGESAVVHCRTKHPDKYLAIIANAMPKQLTVDAKLSLGLTEVLAGQGTLIEHADIDGHLDQVRERRATLPGPNGKDTEH